MTPSRRGFLTGLVSLLAAPAIVRVASIMPVSAPKGVDAIWHIDYGARDSTALFIHDSNGNTILTLNQITREAIRLFANSNAFLQNIDNQYLKVFGDFPSAPVGSRLRIKLLSDYSRA